MLRSIALTLCLVVLAGGFGCGSKPEAKPVATPAKPKKNTPKPPTTPPGGSATPGGGLDDLNGKFNIPPEGSAPPGENPGPPGTPAAGGAVQTIADPVLIQVKDLQMRNILFLPDGRLLASTESGAHIWDLADVSKPTILKAKDEVEKISRVALSPDGQTIAGNGWFGDVHLWSVAGEYAGKIDEPSLFSYGIAFSPKGDFLATNHDQSEVMVFDYPAKTLVSTIKADGAGYVKNLAFTSDGKLLIVWRDRVVVWNCAEKKQEKELKYPGMDQFAGYNEIAVSPTGPEFALIGSGSDFMPKTEIWSSANWQVVGTIQPDAGESFQYFAYSPDGKWLAGVGAVGDFAIWNAATRQKVAQLKGQNVGAKSIAFSHDGRKLAVCNMSDEIRVWSLPELK